MDRRGGCGLRGWATVTCSVLVLMFSAVQAEPIDADKEKKVQRSRRTLITISTLDQMTKLPGDIGPLPAVPIPAANPQTSAKVELGKQLFFDPRLSGMTTGHARPATTRVLDTATAFRGRSALGTRRSWDDILRRSSTLPSTPPNSGMAGPRRWRSRRWGPSWRLGR
jgi:hypothetical protein